MKSPKTHDGRTVAVRSLKTRRIAIIRLALALGFAGLCLVFLIHPLTIGSFASPVFTVSISDAPPVVEGNPTPTPSPTPFASPTPASVFTVSLSAANPGPTPVTVDFATQAGTATAGQDYQNTTGTLSFAMGEQTKTISVPIIPDTLGEGDEFFFVNLSNPQGVTIANGQGKGVITDDDPGGVIQFSQPMFSVNEKDGSATITITRTLDLLGTVTVNFTTSSGTALPGRDYGNTAGTLTFGPGVASQTFTIPILDDGVDEANRSLFLNLSGPTNGATLGSQSVATLLIIDNDPASDIFAITVTNRLLRFRSDTPGTVNVISSITGLQSGEQVAAIDVRPATGQLYALGNTGGTGRLYTINPATAAATLVAVLTADPTDSTSPYTALAGTKFNIDFDPVADRLRVVSNARQNLRVNPANGQVITDTNLAYGASDTNFGANPNIVAAAYNNSFAGATSTTLFDIDSNLDVLVNQDPPNNGLLRTFGQMFDPTNGSAQVNTTELTGLDIRGSDNTIFASLTAPGDSASKLAIVTPGCFGCGVTAATVGAIGGGELVRDVAVAPAGTFQFDATTASVSEGAGKVSLTVTRTGDTTGTSSIECDTADGTATQKGDYTIVRNRLTFGPGETTKQCDISIIDDAFPEPDETFTVSLLFPTANFTPGVTNTVTVTIKDNDNVLGANPIDNSAFFVRQQYLDFLGREPDTAGLNFWVNGIESCGTNQDCRNTKRVDTSAAFFLSIEFQETGFYMLRIQAAAFGRQSTDASGRVSYANFIHDSRQVDAGVIIGQPGANAQLDQNKTAYALQVVSDPLFVQSFTLTTPATSYVNNLFSNAVGCCNKPVPAAERQAAIDAFGIGDTAGRAAALRAVADSNTVRQAQFNPAFVLMEYFGYLRRTSTDPPDDANDFGYQFWLSKLNTAGGDFRQAEMVKAFISSAEYRQRFGP